MRLIIDEWYEKVSGFYVTAEQLSQESGPPREEELKRFHDDKGHRIKFNKNDLDFTYGLRSYWQDKALLIEVSVNNKVEDFDFEDFRRRLTRHYSRMATQAVPPSVNIRSCAYDDVFLLGPSFDDTFKVEVRDGKADIMRLAFRLNPKRLDEALSSVEVGKELIESFCVTPFRNTYAAVYRRTS